MGAPQSTDVTYVYTPTPQPYGFEKVRACVCRAVEYALRTRLRRDLLNLVLSITSWVEESRPRKMSAEVYSTAPNHRRLPTLAFGEGVLTRRRCTLRVLRSASLIRWPLAESHQPPRSR